MGLESRQESTRKRASHLIYSEPREESVRRPDCENCSRYVVKVVE